MCGLLTVFIFLIFAAKQRFECLRYCSTYNLVRDHMYATMQLVALLNGACIKVQIQVYQLDICLNHDKFSFLLVICSVPITPLVICKQE